MKESATHLWARALLLAVSALMALSAVAVSASTGLGVPGWWFAGQLEHRALAGLVAVLSLATLWTLWTGQAKGASEAKGLRMLAVVIVALVAVQAGLGISMARLGHLPWLGMVQASVMHGVFALIATLAVLSSKAWQQPAQIVEDEFRPSLRQIAWMPLLLIGFQVVLGSAYRHGLTGALPHLVGALLVAGLLALVGLLVATTYPKHQPLKTVALSVVWLMLGQVVLGVVALSYRAGSGGRRHLERERGFVYGGTRVAWFVHAGRVCGAGFDDSQARPRCKPIATGIHRVERRLAHNCKGFERGVGQRCPGRAR